VIAGRQWFGMIAAVTLRLLYLIFQQMLGLVLLTGRTANGLALRGVSWLEAVDL
jgi:hypothetical protein